MLDPAWEEELRRGQEAEGEAGSVDDELGYLHLLRHVREPESLTGDQLDALWSAIDTEVGAAAGTPWWRKAWIWWSAPALAAAAVLVVVIVKPGAQDEATSLARHEPAALEAQQAKSAPTPSAASADESVREFGAKASPAPPSEDAKAEAEEQADNAIADGMVGRGGGGEGRASTGGSASPFELSFAKLAPHGRIAIRASVDLSRDELRSELLAKARGGG